MTEGDSSGKIHDISLTIEPGMIVFPGDPAVRVEKVKDIAEGASSNVSLLHMGTHTATHIDAPRHYIPGAAGVDQLPPDVLVGPARVVQLPEVHHVEKENLEAIGLKGVTRLLIGTRNSALLQRKEMELDFAYISSEASNYLVDLGLKLLGVDYLSVEEYHKDGRPTHHTLLEAGIVLVEGLDLSGIPEGDYELMCLPLKIKDADGAPARVFLRELS
jgi:arylformamidase